MSFKFLVRLCKNGSMCYNSEFLRVFGLVYAYVFLAMTCVSSWCFETGVLVVQFLVQVLSFCCEASVCRYCVWLFSLWTAG